MADEGCRRIKKTKDYSVVLNLSIKGLPLLSPLPYLPLLFLHPSHMASPPHAHSWRCLGTLLEQVGEVAMMVPGLVYSLNVMLFLPLLLSILSQKPLCHRKSLTSSQHYITAPHLEATHHNQLCG